MSGGLSILGADAVGEGRIPRNQLFQPVEEAREIIGVGGLALLLGEARVDLEKVHLAERVLDALKLAEAHADAPRHGFQARVGEVFVPLVREDVRYEPHLLGRQFERALVVEEGARDGGDAVLQYDPAEASGEAATRSGLLLPAAFRLRCRDRGMLAPAVAAGRRVPILIVSKIRHEKTSMPY